MERFIKYMCSVILSIIILSVTFSSAFAAETVAGSTLSPDLFVTPDSMELIYQTSYTSTSDWQKPVRENEVAGSSADNSKLNAFALMIPEELGNVLYRVHVSNVGWTEWVSNSQCAGDTYSSDSIQALQIQFTEAAEQNYDIYYRVSVNNIGWLDWAKNGEIAGTTGISEHVNGIQVTYTTKNAQAPGKTDKASVTFEELVNNAVVSYSAHVSEIGWQENVSGGQTSGTTGLGLAIEALKIDLPNASYFSEDSAISYNVYSQNVGWTGDVKNGQEAGTTGQGLRAEAVAISLNGKIASFYDVYYRVHSSFYGWLDWAKNGQQAGTTGIATPAEALEIVLQPKSSPAPGSTERYLINPEYLQEKAVVQYNAYVENMGWLSGFVNGQDGGTTGQSLRLEAFTISLPNKTANSSIIYQAHVSDVGWQEPMSDGNIAGTMNEGRRVEAFTISLTGEDSYSYDVYYQAYSENYGWLGWAKNGEWAGTTGGDLRCEAMHVLLLPRGSEAPGSTDNAYIDATPAPVEEGWLWPVDNYYTISSPFGYRNGSFHYGIDVPAPQGTPIRAAKGGTVTVANWYYGYGLAVVIINDNGGQEVTYGHMSQILSQVGTHVNQGDIIGLVGNTGQSFGNHLHFEINDHGKYINAVDLY